MAIDFSQFILFTPPPKPSQYAINVTESGFVNLNDKLKQCLFTTTKAAGLWMSKDGTRIILDPQAVKPFSIHNNGSIEAIDFTRELFKKGITLPARYDVKLDEDDKKWVGNLIKPKKAAKVAQLTKDIKKVRTAGLADIINK